MGKAVEFEVTPQRATIVRCLADGERTVDIAARVGRTDSTVSAIILDACDRFQLRNRAHLVTYAIEHEWISIDSLAWSTATTSKLDPLSHSVLADVARGYSDKQISDRQFLSYMTVRRIITGLLSNYRLNDRRHLVGWAYKNRILRKGWLDELPSDAQEWSDQDCCGLTAQQFETLRCLSDGMSISDISELLGITESSVRHRIRSLLRVTGLSDPAQLVVWGYESGVLRPRWLIPLLEGTAQPYQILPSRWYTPSFSMYQQARS